jgi:hypothetical protein
MMNNPCSKIVTKKITNVCFPMNEVYMPKRRPRDMHEQKVDHTMNHTSNFSILNIWGYVALDYNK